MKQFILIIFGVFIMTKNAIADQTVHDFLFESLMAKEPIKLSDYTGSVILIVNTASKCGFTGQYEDLEALYQKYKEKGLIVIGVPSDDFGAQELGSNQEIARFCKINYGVTFPMTSKYHVKGDNAHPFYQHARKKLSFGTAPKWNFHKYLIGPDGELKAHFLSEMEPFDPALIARIEEQLSKNS